MSALVDLARVHPSHILEIWPLVCDRLRMAYLRTGMGHTMDLDDDVLSGRAALWIAGECGRIDAAAVAKLVQTNKALVCEIIACGGVNLHSWLHHIAAIEQWAKTQGAVKTRIIGRKGWLRALQNYRVSNVVLERLL